MTIPLLGHSATVAIAAPVPIVAAGTKVPGGPVGYRIAFETRKAMEGVSGQRASVTVYNLGLAKRKALSTFSKRAFEASPVPGLPVDQRYPGIPAAADVAAGTGHLRLTAGYPAFEGEIASGSVVRAFDKRSGPTWTTKIEAQDGAVQRVNGVANKTFPAGTPAPAIAAYLAAALGARPGFISPSFADVSLSEYTAAGDARDELAALIEGASKSYAPIPGQAGNASGYDWWIEDGALNILDAGQPMPGPPLVLAANAIPGAAPLLGLPQALDNGRLKTRSGLWPSVYLGQYTQIADLAGFLATYRVDEIIHKGDTEGDSWSTDLTLSTLL